MTSRGCTCGEKKGEACSACEIAADEYWCDICEQAVDARRCPLCGLKTRKLRGQK